MRAGRGIGTIGGMEGNKRPPWQRQNAPTSAYMAGAVRRRADRLGVHPDDVAYVASLIWGRVQAENGNPPIMRLDSLPMSERDPWHHAALDTLEAWMELTRPTTPSEGVAAP